MMSTACSTQDLTTANGIAIGCARHLEGTIGLKCNWWKDNNDDDYDTLTNFASSRVITVSTAKPFPDMLCWLGLRLRWAHQAQKEQIADCLDKQPVPAFSCNDIYCGQSTFANRIRGKHQLTVKSSGICFFCRLGVFSDVSFLELH